MPFGCKLRSYPSKHLSPIVALLKLVMIRTFTTIEDLSPDWTEGNKLLNELTVKAPIASTLCNKEYRTVHDGAFKRPNTEGTGTGHDTATDLYGHPDFPDGDGHTYLDLAKAAGLVTVLVLLPLFYVVYSGNVAGELCEDIINYSKQERISFCCF
jgi:hypothetical protein